VPAPRRIFYLVTELDPGGAERALYRLVTALDRRRFHPVVGCLRGRGIVGRWLTARGVEVVYFDMFGVVDVGALARVGHEIRRRRPHLVHTFLFHANLVGRLAAPFAKVPHVICSVRVEEPRRLHLWLDRLTQQFVTVEVCVSESARRFTAERAGIPPAKLRVIPNGVVLSDFDDIPPATGAWVLDVGHPLVATVGRLDEQKDPMTFLHAAALVHARQPQACFAWAGRGPLRHRAEREAHRLGLAGAVRFIGYLADVRPLLAQCAVFVLSSRWEGMPNVVLEAMACRKPVVATSVGGCPEVVREGETGYLVPPGNPEALAERIGTLLADPARRRAMGEAGRRRIEADFTHEHTVRLWEELYERVLSDEISAGGSGAE